jgi:hypothetical protein
MPPGTNDAEKYPFSDEDYVQKFADEIATCRDEGYCFVPFIGAGLSVPSGIPEAAALTRYLSWCFLRVLGLDPWADIHTKALALSRSVDAWTPRSGIWPDLAEAMRLRQEAESLNTTKMDQVLKGAIKLLENDERIMDKDGLESRFAFSAELAREVYGALADWRTALALLSRIDHTSRSETDGDDLKNVILTTRDHSVVDSFFQFRMEGKQPCQGHRMIAALAPILRMNVILTPNFDELIERAFEAIDSPLKCFEVPHEVPLPDPQLVTRQRSIIKMHGGSFGLRADYSIDEEPDFNDIAKFLSYLAGRSLPLDSLKKDEKYPNRVALLLCGISGKDQRVVAMLDRARKHFSENLKIFWFCYSDRDVSSIVDRFGAGNVATHGKTQHRATLITIRHLDYGSVLHQIYQRCTNSIPPAGIRFPASWHMPTAPRIPPPAGKKKDEFDKACDALLGAVRSELKKGTRLPVKKTRCPILVPFYGGARGGVTLLSWLFWNYTQLAGQKHNPLPPVYPIWLDLDNVATPAEVFLHLALALAKRGGTANPISSLSLEDFYDNYDNFKEVLSRAFQDHHARTGECLLICINAQESIGSSSPFKAEQWQADTESYKNASNFDKNKPWFTESPENDKENLERVVQMLRNINAKPINGVQCVVVFRQPEKEERVFIKMAKVFGILKKPQSNSFRLLGRISKSLTDFDPKEVAEKALNWVNKKDQWSDLRRPFLQIVMGLRFAGFEASVIRIMERVAVELSSDLCADTDALAAQMRLWLNELARDGVIRWKIGGVIWIKGELREKVVKSLNQRPKKLRPDNLLLIDSLQARWYGRLLLATSDPLAATESVFHAFRGVRQWLTNIPKNPRVESIERLLLMVRHAHGVLNTASTVLEQQLSDQFADRTLILAEASLDATLHACQNANVRVTRRYSKLLRALATCLTACRNDIVTLRIALLLKEGEFKTLIESSPPVIAPEFKMEMAKMDIATARFCFRDYEGGETEFQRLWKEIVDINVSDKKNFDNRTGGEAARKWIGDQSQSAESGATGSGFTLDEKIRFVSRLCHRHIYLRLLQGMSEWLMPQVHREQRRNKRVEYLEQAKWMGDFGMEVLRSISSTGDRYVFEENVRIRAHSALVRAILGFHGHKAIRKSTFCAALTTLNDAEAFIEEFPMREGGLGRVIVELRRAEILLIQSGEGQWLPKLRKQLARVANHGTTDEAPQQDNNVCKKVDQIRSNGFPAKKQADLRERIAIVNEAMLHLERCEHELVNHPKSRWWWWICLVLRVQAAEGLFILRLMLSDAEEYIIPAFMHNFVKSELDRRIKEVAMTDVFQLARIVRSYRRLWAAERIHMIRTDAAKPMRKKSEDDYGKVFKYLCTHLKNALDARNAPEQQELDDRVLRFVEDCLTPVEHDGQ